MSHPSLDNVVSLCLDFSRLDKQTDCGLMPLFPLIFVQNVLAVRFHNRTWICILNSGVHSDLPPGVNHDGMIK